MNWKSILVAGAILFSGDLYTQIPDDTAPAKELYVIKALGFSPIQAYEILPAPDYLKLVRESPTPPAYNGKDLAIDTESETLFVASNTPRGALPEIVIVDAITLERIGGSGAISDISGRNSSIAYDHNKEKVYFLIQGTSLLYVFNWDATATTLVLDGQYDLPAPPPNSNVYFDHIDVDEVNGRLLATNGGVYVYSYDTSNLIGGPELIVFYRDLYHCEPFSGPSVDVLGGYIYAGTFGGTSTEGFCQRNLNSYETKYVVTPGLNSSVKDIDVDQESGLIYMTNIAGNRSTAQILIYDSELNLLSDQVDLGPDYYPTGLIVSGRDIPPYIPVSIDIKPGTEPNCFNIDGHGVIPVAILSDCATGFDATLADATTIEMAGLEVRVVGKSNHYLAHIEDANGDGCDDLVVQIEDNDGAFIPGSGTATLEGSLFDGTPFKGSDSICFVP